MLCGYMLGAGRIVVRSGRFPQKRPENFETAKQCCTRCVTFGVLPCGSEFSGWTSFSKDSLLVGDTDFVVKIRFGMKWCVVDFAPLGPSSALMYSACSNRSTHVTALAVQVKRVSALTSVRVDFCFQRECIPCCRMRRWGAAC